MGLEAWQPPWVQLLMGSQWYLDTQMTNGSEMSDSISDQVSALIQTRRGLLKVNSLYGSCDISPSFRFL